MPSQSNNPHFPQFSYLILALILTQLRSVTLIDSLHVFLISHISQLTSNFLPSAPFTLIYLLDCFVVFYSVYIPNAISVYYPSFLQLYTLHISSILHIHSLFYSAKSTHTFTLTFSFLLGISIDKLSLLP